MIKIALLFLFFYLALSQCASDCDTCQQPNNPLSCLTCPPNYDIYFFNCISEENISTPILIFQIIAFFMVALQVFMLTMGLGVYSTLFQILQMVVLVNWRQSRYGGGVVGWQYLSLAGISNNSFPATFGSQFIVVMIILGIFWLMIIFVNKIPHQPTANFVHKMKMTLSMRIISFIFNILLLSSLMQVTTIDTEPQFKTFAFALAILALIKIFLVLAGLAFTSNSKYFEVNDPTFYTLVQQIKGDKWYVRNNVIIGLLFRGQIIIAFVVGFQVASIVGIVMILLQFFYFLYLAVFIRYTEVRYYIFILGGNFVAVFTLGLSLFGTYNYPGSTHDQLGFYYTLTIVLIAAIYLFATVLQIFLKRQEIGETLIYFYKNYLKCEKDIYFEEFEQTRRSTMELPEHKKSADQAELEPYTRLD